MSEFSWFAFNAMTVITRIGAIDINRDTVSKWIGWVSLVDDSARVWRTWLQVWILRWCDSNTFILSTWWDITFNTFVTFWVDCVSNTSTNWLLDWNTLSIQRYQTSITCVSGWHLTSFIGVEFKTSFTWWTVTILADDGTIGWNFNTIFVDQFVTSNACSTNSINIEWRAFRDSNNTFVVKNSVTLWTSNTNELVTDLNSSWTLSSSFISISASSISYIIRKSWITKCTSEIFIVINSTFLDYSCIRNTELSCGCWGGINKRKTWFTLRTSCGCFGIRIIRGIYFTVINDTCSNTDFSTSITESGGTQGSTSATSSSGRTINITWNSITSIILTLTANKVKIGVKVRFCIIKANIFFNDPSWIRSTVP